MNKLINELITWASYTVRTRTVLWLFIMAAKLAILEITSLTYFSLVEKVQHLVQKGKHLIFHRPLEIVPILEKTNQKVAPLHKHTVYQI